MRSVRPVLEDVLFEVDMTLQSLSMLRTTVERAFDLSKKSRGFTDKTILALELLDAMTVQQRRMRADVMTSRGSALIIHLDLASVSERTSRRKIRSNAGAAADRPALQSVSDNARERREHPEGGETAGSPHPEHVT